MKILIASNNAHKIEELAGIFASFSLPIELISQRSYFGDDSPDIDETGSTLEENALIKAKELEIKSIAFLGKGGGEAKDLADISFIINSDETARIQEIHLFLGHLLCEIVEINLGFSE